MADPDLSPCYPLLPDVGAFNSCVADVGANADIKSCVDGGNLITAPLDAKVKDIGATWNPPDTFSGEQIRAVVAQVFATLDQAASALSQASQDSGLTEYTAALVQGDQVSIQRHRDQANLYLTAAQQADASGAPVAAPNFKQWIMNAMLAGSNAMVTAYTVGCIQPWWAGAWGAFQGAFDVLYGIVKAVVGVAVQAGQVAINAVEGAVTAIGLGVRILTFVTSYWPLLLVAAIGAGWAVHRKRTYGRVFPEGTFAKLRHRIAPRRAEAA